MENTFITTIPLDDILGTEYDYNDLPDDMQLVLNIDFEVTYYYSYNDPYPDEVEVIEANPCDYEDLLGEANLELTDEQVNFINEVIKLESLEPKCMENFRATIASMKLSRVED